MWMTGTLLGGGAGSAGDSTEGGGGVVGGGGGSAEAGADDSSAAPASDVGATIGVSCAFAASVLARIAIAADRRTSGNREVGTCIGRRER
jgi:hypothetical protein